MLLNTAFPLTLTLSRRERGQPLKRHLKSLSHRAEVRFWPQRARETRLKLLLNSLYRRAVNYYFLALI